MTFAKYFGGGGGAAALGVEAFPILTSRTLPAFTKGGRVQITAMSGTGSGARYSEAPAGTARRARTHRHGGRQDH